MSEEVIKIMVVEDNAVYRSHHSSANQVSPYRVPRGRKAGAENERARSSAAQ